MFLALLVEVTLPDALGRTEELVEALSYAHSGARRSLLGPSVASARRERQVVSR